MNDHPMSFFAALELIVQTMHGEPISFVATPCTPWHCLGIDAFVSQRRAKGDWRPGFVLMIPHPKDGLVISRETFAFVANDESTTIISITSLLPVSILQLLELMLVMLWQAFLFSIRNRRTAPLEYDRVPLETPVLLGVRTPDLFTLLNLRRLLGRIVDTFHCVSVDEGLGTYRSLDALAATTRRDRSYPGRSVCVREIDIWLRLRYWAIQRYLCGRIPRSEFFLYSKTESDGSLDINLPVAVAYRAVMGSQRSGPVIKRCREDQRIAMLISQDWSANKSYTEAAEAEFLPRIIQSLNKLGYTVLVKPHPRERSDRYGKLVKEGLCHLLAKEMCVEHVFSDLRSDDLVVGDSSSSLATARAIFGLQSFSFGSFLSERYPPLPYHVKAQQDFCQLTGRFVRSLETIEGFSVAFDSFDVS